MKSWLLQIRTQWWISGLRIGLGTILVVSSVSKLPAQSQFMNEVAGYGLLPLALARVYGVALPWAELFAGGALILGIFTTVALVLCILMALSFATANIYALAQGMSDSCGGCFGQLIPLSNTTALIIDVLMVFAAVLLLLYRGKAASINIGDSFLSILNLNIPKMSKHSAQKISRAILLVVIVLAIGVPLSWGGQTSTAYSRINSSLEQGKPVLLVFYLAGCGECEEQKPIIEEMEQTYQENISFVYIDYKAESGVAFDFEVTGVPTMVLIGGRDGSGYTVLQRFANLTSKERLQRSFYEDLDQSIVYSRYGPIADFSATPTSGHVPVKVQFVDSSLGKVESLAWDFTNDGVIDSTVQEPSYIYGEPGTYTVMLTVHGPRGSSTKTIQEYLRFDSKGCRADFFADSKSVVGITPIRFFDQSEGDIITWEWDFDGDGTIDNIERNPVYTYTANGIYSVSLTIRTPDCEDTLTKDDYITVTGCDG